MSHEIGELDNVVLNTRSVGEARFESSIMGSGAELRDRAFHLMQKRDELVRGAVLVN